MTRIGFIVLLSALSALAAGPLAPAAAQRLHWIRQSGTSTSEIGYGVAVDGAGNVYVTGETSGSLGGPNVGGHDAFLAKYDASGTLLWTRQAGTPEDDRSLGVAVDSSGNAFITGYTEGSLGGPNAAGYDVFLAKYDTSGNHLWSRQLGTTSDDWGQGVAVDGASNAYITGWTLGSLGGPSAGADDAFLAKYDALGNHLWTRQFGTTTDDWGQGVAVDGAGNAYITGWTSGSLGGPNAGMTDAFLAKYDASGNHLWTRQFGTSTVDYAWGLDVDRAGNAYVTGETDRSLGGPNAGGADAFLARFDASGTLLWTRQVGTTWDDKGYGVAVDGAGNAFITGLTDGDLSAPNAGGGSDAFLAKYDASGTLILTHQVGALFDDWSQGVAVDGAGNAYITGFTRGSLGGPNAGGYDVFLAKYGPQPCYADCDTTTGVGVLDLVDFICWQGHFVNGNSYACECDPDPACDIFDFLCFQDAFVAGCP